MIGIFVVVAVLLEVAAMVLSIGTKKEYKLYRAIAYCVCMVIGTLLIFTGCVEWTFRVKVLYLIMSIQVVWAIYILIKYKRKNNFEEIHNFRISKTVMRFVHRTLIILIAFIPLLIFPSYQPIEPTGSYEVATARCTVIDESREETYAKAGAKRNVTMDFWYPDVEVGEENQQFPLVVFSHGAFGIGNSNRSTYEELASHGYVVCSLEHPYHSFVSKQTNGKSVYVNFAFLKEAVNASNGEYSEEENYEITQKWLKIRTGDMNLALNTILEGVNQINAKTMKGEQYKEASSSDSKSRTEQMQNVYSLIDKNKIGVFGHSLGGATAATIGRERKDIDAVIVIDGTMFGEIIGVVEGKEQLNQTPYPVPILNIYNESHYTEALTVKDTYANMVATDYAKDARYTVIKDSEHMNFTDLPLFSPFLAKQLGTGKIDVKHCIKKMNEIVLTYFDYYLKGEGNCEIASQYE